MSKMKVLTIIGTRPEIIKLSMVMKKLDNNTEHIIVHTGQNYDYELNEIFFSDLNIRKPDYFLDVNSDNLGNTIGNIISRSYDIISKIKPDALLIYGDTNSCLSVISAKRLHIPVFHMEAGNRCFDQRVPEENNRKIIDHLSDINMVLTDHARYYLQKEGINPETIIKVGSSLPEIFSFYHDKINNLEILSKKKLKAKDYFVVSIHREENLDVSKNFDNLIDSLNKIAQHYNKKIIFSTHPRTRIKLENKLYNLHKNIELTKPFGFFDYICLQKNAFCTISDSGTLTEEASILGFPAITPRHTHERLEGMDNGVLIMSDLTVDSMIDAIDTVLQQNHNLKKVKDYFAENLSDKIVNIIKSYTNYINRTVWGK